jgi:hypothetical protein
VIGLFSLVVLEECGCVETVGVLTVVMLFTFWEDEEALVVFEKLASELEKGVFDTADIESNFFIVNMPCHENLIQMLVKREWKHAYLL